MAKIHEEITARIVAAVANGVPPCCKPWSTTPGRNVPVNAVNGHEYNGINKVLLWLAGSAWPTPRFLTFRQAQAAGGHVRRGEHGLGIVKVGTWTPADRRTDDGDDPIFGYLKRYVVFNVAQCDDLPVEIIAMPPPPPPRHRDQRDPLIEEFLAATGANISEGGDIAVYCHGADRISLPPFASFDSADQYYTAAFHELNHWTGDKRRLDRDLSKKFAPEHRRAAEELIAELGAAFLCAEFAIDNVVEHASYVDHWSQFLSDKPTAIFVCAAMAQKSVDYLRELVSREPAVAAE